MFRDDGVVPALQGAVIGHDKHVVGEMASKAKVNFIGFGAQTAAVSLFNTNFHTIASPAGGGCLFLLFPCNTSIL
jgi:hypothetical protein